MVHQQREPIAVQGKHLQPIIMNKFAPIVDFIRRTFNSDSEFIPLHAPLFIGNEKEYLTECIDSTFVSSVGEYVNKFENQIAAYTGAKTAVACVNGTNALHLALKLIGVAPGDEVITQPLTFIATANAIAYCGADPVFIDIDKNTLGLSPNHLEEWLIQNTESRTDKNYNPQIFNKRTGKKIKAIIPMHTFGHPCEIDQIINISKKFMIPVIEDAAESLGSYYKGRHTGTFGDVGVLSFNGNKIITTGGGGMLLFNDDELAIKAKHLTTQAKLPHKWEFKHDNIGYNYRMPNINAALGCAQLENLEKYLIAKRTLANKYERFFNQDPSIFFIIQPQNSQSNYWLNTILLSNKYERDSFLEYTNTKGVMTRPAWELMHKLPMFKTAERGPLHNAENIAERLANLPSSVIQ